MYMRKNAKNCKLRRKNGKLHINENPGRKLLGNMRQKTKMQKNIVFVM